MTYSVILQVPRKPGSSLDEFKQHWENIHVPLVKSLVGYEFPLSYTRHYVDQPFATPPIDHGLNKHATNTAGSHEPSNVDGVAVLTFANKEHYDKFSKKLTEVKKHAIYKEDLDSFVNVAALKALFVVSEHVLSAEKFKKLKLFGTGRVRPKRLAETEAWWAGHSLEVFDGPRRAHILLYEGHSAAMVAVLECRSYLNFSGSPIQHHGFQFSGWSVGFSDACAWIAFYPSNLEQFILAPKNLFFH